MFSLPNYFRVTSTDGNESDAERNARLSSVLRYLADVLVQQHMQLQQQQQQEEVLLPLHQQQVDLTAPGARTKKAAAAAHAQEFIKIRPQRENRRYLLWRKITG